MIKQIYELEELTESAEMLRTGPPFWLHALLFGLILALLVATSIVIRKASARPSGPQQQKIEFADPARG
ncbi:MAG TPA: hypothetical protein VJS44_07770 [Pyrinomonadaceae bacterium]|nr:hypothetical protein [Pyrinomonadaceae bacterium]